MESKKKTKITSHEVETTTKTAYVWIVCIETFIAAMTTHCFLPSTSTESTICCFLSKVNSSAERRLTNIVFSLNLGFLAYAAIWRSWGPVKLHTHIQSEYTKKTGSINVELRTCDDVQHKERKYGTHFQKYGTHFLGLNCTAWCPAAFLIVKSDPRKEQTKKHFILALVFSAFFAFQR